MDLLQELQEYIIKIGTILIFHEVSQVEKHQDLLHEIQEYIIKIGTILIYHEVFQVEKHHSPSSVSCQRKFLTPDPFTKDFHDFFLSKLLPELVLLLP